MEGPGTGDSKFTVSTTRNNPAPVGAVTGKQTYASFINSVLSELLWGNNKMLICYSQMLMEEGVVFTSAEL